MCEENSSNSSLAADATLWSALCHWLSARKSQTLAICDHISCTSFIAEGWLVHSLLLFTQISELVAYFNQSLLCGHIIWG
jgi:hypothetical protein